MKRYAVLEENKIVNIATADDPDFATSQGWIECSENIHIGWIYDGESFKPDPTELEKELLEKANSIREQRNNLLAETDWRFRSDLSPSQEWIDYCQALRDVPSQEGFPENVTWPTKPS